MVAHGAGCRSYEPRPLTQGSVDAALETPALETLALEQSPLVHPLLGTLTLDPADGLGPDEAACFAVILNPDLRAEREKRRVAAAQTLQAGLLPDPQLSASFDRPYGDASVGTVDGYTLDLGWDVGALVEARANLSAARAEDRAAALDLLWQEWSVASGARLAVTRAAWSARLCDVLGDAVARAQAARDALSAAVEASSTTRLELDAAEATLHGYVAQLRAAERARDLAAIDVRRAIGLAPDCALTFTPPDEEPGAPLPSLDSAFAAARDARVDLAALRAGYEAQEERLRAAVLSQFPRLNLSLNAARDTGAVESLGVGLGLVLPVFDRSQGRIATEAATREQLFAEYTARVFALRADLAAILAELRRLEPEIEAQSAFSAEVEELLGGLEEEEQRQLVDLLGVEQLRATAISARVELLGLEQRRAELRVALETVTGRLASGGRS